MEGGILPWRTQSICNNCPDLVDACSKSLPPPPSGYFWEKDEENGNWVLSELPKAFEMEGSVVFMKPSVVEHIIMPTDTIQGICLRYRVTSTDLRRANLFSGNNIRFKTSLLIPINGGSIVNPQVETHDVTLQRFKNITGEGIEEARMYLEEYEWDLRKAIDGWNDDRRWEETQSGSFCTKYFSSELPTEDFIFPTRVEIPAMVIPVHISNDPPTFIYEQNSTDDNCEPLLS